MVFTRTHTRFFAEDHVAELQKVCLAMEHDLNDRAPAIDADTLHRAKVRLNALTMAIELCGEEAD
jgi:hypothetical protein